MDEKEKQLEEEIADLKEEMENFKKEKERVRAIVGKLGGMPEVNTKIFNFIFGIAIIICIVVSLVTGGTWRLVMIEMAIAALSFKLIYLMHKQSRVNNFQLWILSSLEWRLNEIISELKKK